MIYDLTQTVNEDLPVYPGDPSVKLEQKKYQLWALTPVVWILPIENLTGLEPLIGKNFDLYALPLKLEKDGAPTRVIARMEES